MESVKFDGERGQILVQVALMVGVLFAFVALALDGGQIYARRRQMQNAADAGALAGAREICFGGHDSLEAAHSAAEAAAHEYAEDRNGSQPAQVDIVDEYTVTVVTSQTFNTFLAGVIGINEANVRADATAMCGRSRSAGGMWPLAYKYPTWEQIPCDTPFWVFNQKDDDKIACGIDCDCDEIGPHFGPGDRGWLQFFVPNSVPSGCTANRDPHNCGVPSLRCWLMYDHPGPIEEGDCIPGESGVNQTVETEVNWRAENDPFVNVILWDDTIPCDDIDPEYGNCNGSPYRVVGFGCIEVLGTDTIDIPQLDDPSKNCVQNLKVIHAIKRCGEECQSQSGSTGGEVPQDPEVRSVSLVD